MRRKSIAIPQEDMEAINKSFAKEEAAPTILKDGRGSPIRAERKLVNPRSYAISDFRGKKLKGSKSFIPVGGKQITVGVAGQLFDDIPEELRSQVPWFASDFKQ